MLDKVLKLATIVAVLMAGGGALHYFVMYLPAAEDKKRVLAATELRKREVEMAQVKNKFNICVVSAKNDYNTSWDDYCEARGLKRDCPLAQPVLEQFTRTRDNALRHCEIEARVNLD